MKTIRVISTLVLTLVAQYAAAGLWQSELDNSEIKFDTIADGAPFDGQFNQFQAELQLSDLGIEHSDISVTLELASVDTQWSDGDMLLMGGDFFNTSQWPKAQLTSTKIRHISGNTYVCDAQLDIKGIKKNIEVTFNAKDIQGGVREQKIITGFFVLNRLDFDIGIGEWINTDWIANETQISFKLSLYPASK